MKGIAPGGDSHSVAPMDIKDEFTFVIEWLKPSRATALHISATNASPFKSLIENSKANKGSF